jgi:AraC-like DNA-binding protein
MFLLKYIKEFILKYRAKDATSKNVFDHYFFDLKYYLHQETSSEDFSLLLNISIEKLDQIAIQYYGNNFQSLLNECRYRHLMEELESPINSNISIESIIKLSGFTRNEHFDHFLKTKQGDAIVINGLSENSHTKHPKSS